MYIRQSHMFDSLLVLLYKMKQQHAAHSTSRDKRNPIVVVLSLVYIDGSYCSLHNKENRRIRGRYYKSHQHLISDT